MPSPQRPPRTPTARNPGPPGSPTPRPPTYFSTHPPGRSRRRRRRLPAETRGFPGAGGANDSSITSARNRSQSPRVPRAPGPRAASAALRGVAGLWAARGGPVAPSSRVPHHRTFRRGFSFLHGDFRKDPPAPIVKHNPRSSSSSDPHGLDCPRSFPTATPGATRSAPCRSGASSGVGW